MSTPVSVVNKIQTVFPPRAAQYVEGATTGSVVNLNRVFKGLGALQAYSVPLGTPVTATLLPPLGPRSQGFTLRAQLQISATSDVVVFEL